MSSNNELENTILDRFPYPIANCYYRFINIEESGTSKFGILLDVAESYLHYLATVLLSVYAVETKPHTDLTIRLIEKFRKGQWGCGDYVEMIREISRFYQSSPDQLPYPQLTHFVKNYLKEIEELAQIRNKQWGHLSGKSDAFHASILLETQSKVEFLLQQSDWLGNCPLWLPRETNEEQTLIIKADNYQSSRMLKGRSVNISIHPDDITKQHIILKRTFLLTGENKKYWILFPITLYVQQHNVGQLLLLQNLDWQSKNKNQLKKLTYINYEPLCPNYEAKEPDILQALQSKILSLLQSLPLDKQMAFDKTIVTKELINPYKGLDVFNVKDKPLFFGRDNINQTILEQLKHQPLIVLIGSSGSGKSSLIQAGICANLSPNDWYYTQPCHFGKYPLSNLQSILEMDSAISNEDDLINAIQQLVQIHHKRLLLIIDPFEELFVQNDQETQKKVIEILLKTLQYFHHEPVFRMLIGIRADFFELFKTAFTDYPVTWLPSLTKQQFIEIIEEPAKQTGLNLESGLTDRIITDLGFSEKSKSDEITNRLGLLPLIEFALSKLFDESKQQGKLTHENYRKIHGVNGALIEHIKSQLNQLNSEEQVELPRLLLSLISIKEEGFGRQKRFIADLDELQRQLAQKLITARLLVSHQESVELAHEALIQHWEELQGWITKYKEFKQWQQKLQQAVQDWQLNHQENTDLWRGARLNEAELKIKGYEHWLSSIEKAFIQASIVLRQTELLTKQRQQRRLKLLTSVALIIAIVAGFFYWQAEEQKDIANQQRDLALEAVNTLTYGNIEKLLNIAGTRQYILPIFEQNIQTLDAIYALEPDQNEAQREKSVNLNNIGDMWLVLGDTQKALQAYQQMNEILEKLAAADPLNSESQRDLSVSYSRLGDVQLRLGQTEQALQAYQQSIEIDKKLAAADPLNSQSQRDLSVSFNKLGNVQLELGKTEQALQAYQQGLEVAKKLAAADPLNSESQRDLSVSFNKLGNVQLELGKTEQALQAYQQGLQIREKLAAADPLNSESQRDLSVSYSKLGDVQLRLGQTEQALQAYQQGLEVAEKLATADPLNSQSQRDLSVSYSKIAEVYLKTKQLNEALSWYQKSLALDEKLLEQDPQNQTLKDDVKIDQRQIAKVKQQMEESAQEKE
jgi:tetratricopeptide (TPR) repeat protein